MMDGAGDDHLEPNSENILREIRNLVAGAKPGDHFLFHYSGHSGQIINEDNTEEDGLDEVLIPSDDKDFDKIITDDQLRKYLVDALPIGSSLVAIIDCCHSGSMLDLEHFRCNRVYTPWVDNGNRRWSDMRRMGVVRRLAISSRGPSLHIYENTRVDSEIVLLKKTSLDFSLDSGQASITRRSSSIRSDLEPDWESSQSTRSSEEFFDALESPHSVVSHRHHSSQGTGPNSPSLESPIPACSSPLQDYCSGFCEPTTEEKPYVVCLAACKDSQDSWESEDGRSMTLAMIDYLRQNPHPKLDDLLKYISHYVYQLAVDRHQSIRHMRRVFKNSEDPDERMAWKEFEKSGYHAERYQDPQISSLHPLDMQAAFTL